MFEIRQILNVPTGSRYLSDDILADKYETKEKKYLLILRCVLFIV
jgi:hypothetical protein